MKRIRASLLMLIVSFGVAGHEVQATQVVMHGQVDYVIQSRTRVEIDVEDLANFDAQTTERLRFRLWASEHHWSPRFPGRLIANTRIARLYPYQVMHHVSPRVHLHFPPTGWYYVTLVVEERVLDESGKHWVIRDVHSFDGRRFFQRPGTGLP